MRKILFSIFAALAVLGCNGLLPGDDGDLPLLGGGNNDDRYIYGSCTDYYSDYCYDDVSQYDCESYIGGYFVRNGVCDGGYGNVYGSCTDYYSGYCYEDVSQRECENYYDGYFVRNGACNNTQPSSSSLPSSSSSVPPSSSPSSSSRPSSSSSAPPPYISKGNSISNYRTVTIGTQVWMAENLDYNVAGSKCYNNQDSYCATYGRLYDWATAMALPSSCNTSSCSSQINAKHKGICPSGWHIPSDNDWSTLFDYVGGISTAGKHLKAQDGWYNCGSGGGYSYSCEDTYGFAALPGGYGFSDGSFGNAGNVGYWWSASEYDGGNAYCRGMIYYSEGADWLSGKAGLFSIRCVKDD